MAIDGMTAGTVSAQPESSQGADEVVPIRTAILLAHPVKG